MELVIDFKSETMIVPIGIHTKSLELRYSNADFVLYFNYPRWLCYLRVFKRLFNKDSEIDDRALGCKETVRISLLRYMWNFEQRVKDIIVGLKDKYPDVKFIEITNDKQLQDITVNLLDSVVEE
jgi:adenylate kinase family enzyme